MEKVHMPHLRSHVCDKVSIKEFVREFTKELSGADDESDDESDEGRGKDLCKNLAKELFTNIPKDVQKELTNICDENVLTCQGEPLVYPYQRKYRGYSWNDSIPGVPKNVDLVTLKMVKRDYHGRNSTLLRKYYLGMQRTPKKEEEPQNEDVEERVQYPDAVLSVVICSPYTRPKENFLKLDLKIENKFLVLGSQFLTALRDKIFCVNDIGVSGDFSDNPSNISEARAKDIYKGNFFYIDGAFYNDTRDPTASDNSRVIIDWAKDPACGIGPFGVKDMQSTRFMDLEIQLGYPYVYQHQGNCEHLIIFTDLRLLSEDDCQDVTKYPIITSCSRCTRLVCMVCGLFTAKWIVKESKRLPYDPFFFCENCFHSFNYDADGNKVGHFTASLYFDRTAIM